MKIKRTKPLCECGEPSTLNGYCRKCYMRNYMRERAIRLGIARSCRKPKTHYESVLKRVKTGKPIYVACEELRITTKQLYQEITTDQRNHLFEIRREVVSMESA